MNKIIQPTPEQRSASNPNSSVWVTANAGSGKTHVLVERLIRLLLDGAEPSAILCITYTKAAAAEMSTRLFKRLTAWVALDDARLASELLHLDQTKPTPEKLVQARRLFTRCLETPGGLKIQTIHAFCERLLHLFPVEAGLAPGFRVLDDRRATELQEKALFEVLELAKTEHIPELANAFQTVVGNIGIEAFESLIKSFVEASKRSSLLQQPQFDRTLYEATLKKALGLGIGLTLQEVGNQINTIDAATYVLHAQILSVFKPHRKRDVAALMKVIIGQSDRITLLKELFLNQDLEPRADLMATKTALAHPDTELFLSNEAARCTALFLQYDLLQRIEASGCAFILARAITEKIEIQKSQYALYEFDDLIAHTVALLNSSRAAQWVLYKLDTGLKHILVDEAQDTSPSQWKIIGALAEEFFAGQGRDHKVGRTLFVVGDRKQSIYSFQGADAHAFAIARDEFKTRLDINGKPPQEIDLAISYRSTKQILEIVDRVFPSNSPQSLGFSVDDPSDREHTTNRQGQDGVVEFWPLMLSAEESDSDDYWQAPIDREPTHSAKRILARHVASLIKGWLGKRLLVARSRAVMPSDILILLQSRGPLFSMLIAELRRAEIPVAGADRLHLRKSLVIQDLCKLLQWLLLPDDDHALACILKSPLVAEPLNEEGLFDLAYGRGTTSLWERMIVTGNANVGQLKNWKGIIEGQGPYEFFASVLTTSRKRILSRLGPEARDASDAFLDLAMGYQSEYGHSLFGFLTWFNSGETQIRREMETASGEVRLMTVHGAKGLEANIVILPDAASVPKGPMAAQIVEIPNEYFGAGLPIWMLGKLTTAPELEKWKTHAEAKTKAERNRLLYVALTRACDELYIFGAGGKRKIDKSCWYATVEEKLGVVKQGDVFRVGSPPATIEPPAGQAQSSPFEIPSWALQLAPPERLFEPKNRVTTAKNFDPLAAKRGTAIHTLLQELPNIEPERRESYARRKATRLGLSEFETAQLVRLVSRADLAPFFGPNSRGEVEIQGNLAGGRTLSGRIDRVVILPEEVLILDYKSDHHLPKNLNGSHPYVAQLAIYSSLMASLYSDRRVKAALLWTQFSKLEWIPPDILSQAANQALQQFDSQAS